MFLMLSDCGDRGSIPVKESPLALPALLGHQDLLDSLCEAFDDARLHHAYLLQGPPGVGKATFARRLAMYANCESASRPCGQCPTCVKIAAGTHPDILEITPQGSSIPVSVIRELIRKTGYHRYSARHRFIIIDPAEAMQTSAANALLKTLEEPPDGTGFLLLTSQPASLLPTIRSRCQQLRLSPVPQADLTQWLTARGVSSAQTLATLADGRPGRALELADGGLERREAVRGALLSALRGNLDTIYKTSESLTSGKRAEWTTKVQLLIEIAEELIRDTVHLGAGSSQPLAHEDLRDMLTQWSRQLWPSGVGACVRALEEAKENLRRNVAGKTLLDSLFSQLSAALGPARHASAS